VPLTQADMSLNGDVAPDCVPELVPVQQPQVPVFEAPVDCREGIQWIVDRAEHSEFLLDGGGDGQLRLEQPRSLVIATVDKLAQLPWRGYAGMLFGRVSSRCPRHGYRHDDLDDRTG
jgi:hypothetical protein